MQIESAGPCTEALEAFLSSLNMGSGVLAQTARKITVEVDAGASGDNLVRLSCELRQLMKAICDEAAAKPSLSAVDEFLASISAEDFR